VKIFFVQEVKWVRGKMIFRSGF